MINWPPIVRRISGIGVLILLVLAGTGCSSLHRGSEIRVIRSAPAVKAIELVSPATVNREGTMVTFPPGKYRAVYEDDRGYYFQAPSKVLVDGDLCLPRRSLHRERKDFAEPVVSGQA